MAEIEASESPAKYACVDQALSKLSTLEGEFRALHFQLIDELVSEEDLEAQQEILDCVEEDTDSLRLKLTSLSRAAPPTISKDRETRVIGARLSNLDRRLHSIDEAVSTLDKHTPDQHLVRQYKEQLGDIKRDLHRVHSHMLDIELDSGHAHCGTYSGLDKALLACSLKVSRLSTDGSPVSRATVEREGVKLPKLEVPVFDGDILNWRQLVYLQHALKEGSARSVIDGLSQSGDNYDIAIECLKDRFDRPRLIHQTHV